MSPAKNGKARRAKRGAETDARSLKLDSILTSAFAHLGLASKLREYTVRKVWADCVGATIARRALPKRLIGSTLYCSVSSSPWMTELTYQKAAIIEKLNRLLNCTAVTEIVFRIGTVAEAKETRKDEVKHRVLSEEEKAFIDRTASRIKDEHLKGLIKKVMEKSKG